MHSILFTKSISIFFILACKWCLLKIYNGDHKYRGIFQPDRIKNKNKFWAGQNMLILPL
jgi:hypothetical protein